MSKVLVSCVVCGKEFLKNPCDAKRFKTCSLECRGKYSSMKYQKKVEKVCEVCGSTYLVKPSHVDSRHTCSVECRYKRLEGHLSTLSGSGEGSVNWKGGRHVTPKGYVLIHAPENPMANSRGYVREHRLVMSQHIGRYLTDDEEVHHIDENKSNNDISNLQLMTKAEHTRLHALTREYERAENGRIIGLKRTNDNETKAKSE